MNKRTVKEASAAIAAAFRRDMIAGAGERAAKAQFLLAFAGPPNPLTRIERLRAWVQRLRLRLGEIVAGRRFDEEW